MVNNFGLEDRPKTYSWSMLGQDLDKSPAYVARIAKERLPDRMLVKVGKHTLLRHGAANEARLLLLNGTNAKVDALPEPDDHYNYGEERARREHYEAEFSRLKLEERRGNLLDTKAVQKVYTDAVKTTSKRLLQVPRQLAAEVSSVEPAEAEQLLETAIRLALDELKSASVDGIPLNADD